jgi:formamidopyrimidine-DNA glycosylase
MPELPEVETVRRGVAQRVVGRRVTAVAVHRPGVVYRAGEGGRGPSAASAASVGGARLGRELLLGGRIAAVRRHGKQLALVADDGRAVCVHLGMSGSLCGREREAHAGIAGASGGSGGEEADPHVHVVWQIAGGGQVRFRDPRRFGGLWVLGSEAELATRWAGLGPDALTITPGQLHAGLSRTQRELKAALLDQGRVAGLGNIYVDELLFAVRLHPRKTAAAVTKAESQRLVRAMRRLLGRAIALGGSTLRDYVDASGAAGGFQSRFRVYGRHGEPCRSCGLTLERLEVAGRTTTACRGCQRGASLSG